MLVVNTNQLRQQAWRAESIYKRFLVYAKSLGCSVIHDEIVADDEQARHLSRWWLENATS